MTATLGDRARYWKRRWRLRGSRYRNLLQLVRRHRPRTLVEIGVYRGKHAREMIETASLFRPAGEIEYHGFDLFEELDDEDLAREFSKRPPSQAEVQALLEPTGARIHLYRGYTTDTLPPFVERREAEGRPVDFVFLDGGHSHETIGFDWSRVSRIVRPGGVVVFDDYYENDPAEVPGIGCQRLVGELDARRFGVELLEPVNAYPKDWGTLRTRMVAVSFQAPG